MNRKLRLLLMFILCVSVSSFAPVLRAEPDDAEQPAEDAKRLSVDAARQRAKLMHNIYDATLDVMHHRYFRDDRSTVPARAMEDVFVEIQRKENIESRWISVNAKAMSIDHKPQDAFEKDAAKALRTGGDFERVEDGKYRRATAIRLSAGCLSCHGSFAVGTQAPRFVGLVLSIPVKKDRPTK